LVIAVGQNVAGSDTLASVVVCTVTLSIIAHGLSANPLVRAFSAREAQSQT
jgi:NhaP-type Na+/H+ or K+/H+ antiporter